jgi:hypothetical protein
MNVKRKKLCGLGKHWKHKVYILFEQNRLFVYISHNTAQCGKYYKGGERLNQYCVQNFETVCKESS